MTRPFFMQKMIVLLILTALLSSCSVMLASRIEGVEMESLQKLESRQELIALGAQVLLAERNEKGDLVEIYQILEPRGSMARACMHGLLDISTAFLWEFAGTPIETALTQKKFISVKVTFDNEEKIQKMELF